MRDPNRIPRILGLIKEIWEKCPDLRLGQLLTNSCLVTNYHEVFRDVRLDQIYEIGKMESTPNTHIVSGDQYEHDATDDIFDNDIYFVEDDVMEDKLKAYLEKIK